MDLVHADEALRHDAHLLGHPAAIFRDIGGIVVRTEAAIEALVDSAGYAALAGEEGVAQAGNGREQRRSERHGVSRSGRRRFVADARDRGEIGLGDRQHLEHRAHAAAAAVGQPLQRAGNIGGNLRRGFCHQRDGPGLDAEPLEELALRHRAVDARADIFRRARQRLEIDMGGDVGLARIFQGIGKAVAGDGLEGVAGVAAQMAVIDDQRRAVLVAHPRRDLHHLGVRPPFEHGADRGRAHQRRQQHFEARHRLGGGAEHQLAIASRSTTRSCQPVSRLTT